MSMNCVRHEEGSALVLALIAAFLLLIISAEVAHTTRVESFITKNVEIDAKLEAACRSGLERATAILREDRQTTEIDSLNDNWARLYVDNELLESEFGDNEFLYDDEEEEPLPITLYIEIFDESAKFNIYYLRTQDPVERRKRREKFTNLIDRFRADYEFDLSSSDGQAIGDQILEFLNRDEERPYNNVPTPQTKSPGSLNDLAELLYVADITPEILWDQVDEEGEVLIPGLFRFLTIWSDMQININTAPLATLSALFEPKYEYLAERILDFREKADEEREEEEGRVSNSGTFDENAQDEEVDPTGGAPFSQISDLRQKVEDIGQEVYNDAQTQLTVQSQVFSVFVTAEQGRAHRTKMWVLRRSEKGFQIVLERPVDFAYYIPRERLDQGNEEAEERYK